MGSGPGLRGHWILAGRQNNSGGPPVFCRVVELAFDNPICLMIERSSKVRAGADVWLLWNGAEGGMQQLEQSRVGRFAASGSGVSVVTCLGRCGPRATRKWLNHWSGIDSNRGPNLITQSLNMKTPNRSITLAMFLAAALTLPNLAMAGVKTGKGPVGIKLGATASTTLDVTMAAGADPYTQTNWNNPTTGTGGFAPGGGKSQDGVATALGVYWSASAGIITAGTSSTGDGRLLASYLDSGGNPNTVPSDGTPVSGVSLTANGNNEPWLYVTNLTAWLATNGACDYDVVVYVDGVTPGLISHYWVEKAVGLGSSMTVGPNLTPPIYVQQQDLSAYLSSPGYSQASSSSYGSAGPANYMVFAGLTADSILIRSEEDQPAVSNVVRSPISAVQLWPRSSDPVVFNYTPESPRTNAAADVVRLVNAASGCGISAYQWMAGPIGSGTYTNVRDAGTISGSSTVQLTISNLAGANQAEYVLVASNGTSAVYGSPIQVYVISTLFTNSPVDTTRYAGGTASFFASADGCGDHNVSVV